MIKKNKIAAVVVLGLMGGAAGSAFGFPLKEYRGLLGSTQMMELIAGKRISKVRGLLLARGEKLPTFAGLVDPRGPFKVWPEGSDNGHKSSSSGLVKKTLSKVAEDLRRQELQGRPMTFKPSTFSPDEMEQELAASRNGFCEERLGKTKKYPELVNQYAGFLKLNSGQAKNAIGDTRRGDRTERDRAVLIEEYIRHFGPKLKEQTIHGVLGAVEKVQFVDEHVIRLTFVKREGDRPNGGITESIPVTLSMLTTFRTDRDKYYLVMVDCLANYVNQRIAAERTGPESKADLELVQNDLNGKIEDGKQVVRGKLPEAKAIHKKIGALVPQDTLDTRQLDFLIDLFVQMRGLDVPAEEEMEFPDDPSTWTPAISKSVAAFIRHEEKIAEKRGTPKLPVVTMDEDYHYYRLLNQQLYELEAHLESERDMEKRTNAMVLDVKGMF